ncbi:MAG: 2-phospho-L-lactate guanylyltransferase, partial [Actinomycetota bacterium]
MPDRIALVIPVRSFEHGKTRLADAFTPAQRSRLARAMAEIVVAPRVDADTIVVCNDESIAHWARSRAAQVVTTDATGLNPSL